MEHAPQSTIRHSSPVRVMAVAAEVGMRRSKHVSDTPVKRSSRKEKTGLGRAKRLAVIFKQLKTGWKMRIIHGVVVEIKVVIRDHSVEDGAHSHIASDGLFYLAAPISPSKPLPNNHADIGNGTVDGDMLSLPWLLVILNCEPAGRPH